MKADLTIQPQAASRCPIHGMFRTGDEGRSLASRAGIFTLGLTAYALFGVTILYAIGFVTELFVPKAINDGVAGPTLPTVLINSSLLMLFVVQHTIMARPAFKRWWTRFVPAPIERSIFVIAASASLLLLFWQWRPMPGVIYDLSGIPAPFWGLKLVSLAGFGIVLAASFMVSHFDLFGLRQTWFATLNRPYKPVSFRLVGLYKIVRHPLMLGFLVAFWATPVMTVGHLFFAAMTTLYICFGTWIEEKDLVAQFGDTYRLYQRNVRGFVPIPVRRGEED